jgi:hypothetical protein
MTKLSLLSVAAATAYAFLMAPTFAQSRSTHVVNSYAQADFCAGHEPGNPYSKETDYWSWSAWRVRGGWDDRNDYKCTPSHMGHGGF